MNQEVRISICVPARNRPQGLIRLLSSILNQTYKNYEVIILDNSDGNELETLVQHSYREHEQIRYYRNNRILNMGENWNACIAHASFDWIKMMHDDDWFTNEYSLENIANSIKDSAYKAHTFSYYNVTESGRSTLVKENRMMFQLFQRFPYYVYKRNYIGNPCCTLIHRSCNVTYNDRLKWLVDVHYYLRLMIQGHRFEYHPTPVINIGISDQQATVQYKHNIEVELHEHDIVSTEFESKGFFKSYFVFDTLWRLVRNTGLKQEDCDGLGNVKLRDLLIYCTRIQHTLPSSMIRSRFFSGIIKPIAYFFSN